MGAVVEMSNGIRLLVNTDHSSLFVEPYPKDFLSELSDFYQDAFASAKTARDLLP